jgi:hypothetical protein
MTMHLSMMVDRVGDFEVAGGSHLVDIECRCEAGGRLMSPLFPLRSVSTNAIEETRERFLI